MGHAGEPLASFRRGCSPTRRQWRCTRPQQESAPPEHYRYAPRLKVDSGRALAGGPTSRTRPSGSGSARPRERMHRCRSTTCGASRALCRARRKGSCRSCRRPRARAPRARQSGHPSHSARAPLACRHMIELEIVARGCVSRTKRRRASGARAVRRAIHAAVRKNRAPGWPRQSARTRAACSWPLGGSVHLAGLA